MDRSGAFIGRKVELDALATALAGALAGRPRVVLLSGEPGIGKTRTAQEFAALAEQRQVLVLRGRCPEEPGAPPYWPWRQLLHHFVSLHDDQVIRAALGPGARQIAALDPEFERFVEAGAAAPAELDPASARFRLFDAMARFWRRVAARQPVLLVIDDLHGADAPSLRLLEFLAAEVGTSPLMLLGTFRDAQVTRQHPLSDTLAQLPRHLPVQRLALAGFGPAETALFVAHATGSPSIELAGVLQHRTEGHPLFLCEVVRDIVRDRAQGRSDVGGARQAEWRVPGGVREVIGARLNRLTPACLEVLQSAAVIGREFPIELLVRVLDGMSAAECTAALTEAQRAALVDESTRSGRCQFAHAMIQETLYDELPALRRTLLHRRIAAVLEAQYAADLTPWLSLLAHHSHAAGSVGDGGKAIGYATRAAEHATAMLAHEEAVRYYALACSLLPEAAGPQRCQLLLGLGDAQKCAGDSESALGSFALAADGARLLADPALLARCAIGYGEAQWRLGADGTQAAALAEEALRSTAPGDARQRVELLTALCQAQLFSDRPDDAEATHRQAVGMARRLGDPLLLVRALCAILPGRWYPERLAARLEAAREAMQLVPRVGHPGWVAPYLYGWHIGDLMEQGDAPAAAATAQYLHATSKQLREPFVQAVALAALAMIATHEGRFAEAEELSAQAMQCGARFDRDNAAGIFGVQMFTIRWLQGRLGELAPVLQQFLASEASAAVWRPGLLILHCELDAPEQARAVFDELATDGFAGIARDAIQVATIAYLAEVCVCLGDAARAAMLFDLLLPYADRDLVFGAHTASFGAGARLLGMLAATQRRWDEAERHFEFALAFDARTGARPWLVRTRHEFAGMLLRRARPGDRERARTLLAAALADAQGLGMRGLEVRILDLRRRLAGDQDRPVRVAGLSPREVQVLQLVAAGRTNQEIAAALFRSPATVAIHVRNILSKTKAANRAEAAAFAVRHGLLPPA